MNKIITTLLVIFTFQMAAKAQITVSSAASNYDTIFGGAPLYYQYAWDEPLDEDYPEIFKLSKPLKAFNNLWDSALVADGSLWLLSSSNPDVMLIVDGTGWDLMDKGYENDSLGLNNISLVRLSDSMDRIEWRNFGFYNEYDSTLQLPSSGSVQLQVSSSDKVDIIFGDFVIVHPDLCFEGYGSLRPSVTYFDEKDSAYTWFLYGNPESPSIGQRTDTAFDHLPVLGQKITLDFNKTNFIKRLSKVNISVSPNPVVSQIKLNGLDFSGKSFQIISIDGRTVSKGKIEMNQINVDELKSGNYILKIQGKDQIYYSRFIKQ